MTIGLETEVEERLQQITEAYGSMCCRTSVAQTAVELGLLLMAVPAAKLNDNITLLDCEMEQIRKLTQLLPGQQQS